MDYAEIGFDNQCSACIQHKIDNFIGSFEDVNIYIKGFGGERVYNIKIVPYNGNDTMTKEENLTFASPTTTISWAEK